MRAKGKTTLTLIVVVFGLVVVTVVPASAKKPAQPESVPLGGTVCAAEDYPEDITYTEDGFRFTLRGRSDSACIDVMSDAGVWEVTIGGSGARSLGLMPRDSFRPGDSCGGYPNLRNDDIYIWGSDNPLVLGYDGTIPAATINACDYLNGRDDAFPEWVALGTVPDPEEQCVAIEDGQCLVADQLPVPHPLVLHAFMRGSENATVIIEVKLP